MVVFLTFRARGMGGIVWQSPAQAPVPQRLYTQGATQALANANRRVWEQTVQDCVPCFAPGFKPVAAVGTHICTKCPTP